MNNARLACGYAWFCRELRVAVAAVVYSPPADNVAIGVVHQDEVGIIVLDAAAHIEQSPDALGRYS